MDGLEQRLSPLFVWSVPALIRYLSRVDRGHRRLVRREHGQGSDGVGLAGEHGGDGVADAQHSGHHLHEKDGAAEAVVPAVLEQQTNIAIPADKAKGQCLSKTIN